ncbi:hypothetical protein BJ170DRAFT_309206 [Xylariales sp. AK1849]|nr:hypothetical protein BJ170DRAFT_309206 [Xylariales sp. AK1849]
MTGTTYHESLLGAIDSGAGPYRSNNPSIQSQGVDPGDHLVTVRLASAATTPINHRDSYGRLDRFPANKAGDFYLRSRDGRLVPLRVQRSDRLRSSSPMIIEIIRWMYSGTINSDPWQDHHGTQSSPDYFPVFVKWLPGSLAILLLLCFPTDLEGEFRNGGYYDPVRYRDWLYDKFARNSYENEAASLPASQAKHEETAPLVENEEGDYDLPEYPKGSRQYSRANLDVVSLSSKNMAAHVLDIRRELGPKSLCFLMHDGIGGYTYRTMTVHDYMQETKAEAEPEYVFLSYTRKQFCVATSADLDTWAISEEERRKLKLLSPDDRNKLGRYGIEAAQKAKVPAFWLDFECLRPDSAAGETSDSMSDVYRICDIVRTCKSMFIVRGPPLRNGTKLDPPNPISKAGWLRQWGERLWTVPEALLCPNDVIDIYTDSPDGPQLPEPASKRRLAARAWEDADNLRQLIDHYESTIHLTPLELVSIALEGLQWRKTDMKTPGDTSYALMGLLRRRPTVDKNDGDFEAFARLSLANDSDMLLERLLCMQTSSPQAPWHEIKDAWGAKLWDIEPHCQIAGIVDNRTVTLDGAFGATICWNKLPHVAFYKRRTVGRMVAKILLRAIPAYFILGIAMLIGGVVMSGGAALGSSYSDRYDQDQTSPSTNALLDTGAVITALAGILGLIAPSWLLALYRGKFQSTQAWFIGVTGIPDLGYAEECLFGVNCGRLQWSTSGSLLSRHERRNGERRALPPGAVSSEPSSLKIFTLIDTFSLTATSFWAEQPPSVVMICGREGGMQRAVLCSYDWKTQTFCREAVLRMKTLVLERMSRVDRFRFCLSRYGRETNPNNRG